MQKIGSKFARRLNAGKYRICTIIYCFAIVGWTGDGHTASKGKHRTSGYYCDVRDVHVPVAEGPLIYFLLPLPLKTSHVARTNKATDCQNHNFREFLFFIILYLVSLEHSVKNDLKEMAYWGVRIWLCWATFYVHINFTWPYQLSVDKALSVSWESFLTPSRLILFSFSRGNVIVCYKF